MIDGTFEISQYYFMPG